MGVEMERIMEYDTLAAMLNDFAYDSNGRMYKDYEGLSSDNFGVYRHEETNIGGWTDHHTPAVSGTTATSGDIGWNNTVIKHGYKP